jgi:steroid delta-isomerase-like uncharacterized protein
VIAMPHSTETIARRWFEEVWNHKRDATIDELFGPDTVAHGLGESEAPIHGPEEFRIFFRNMLDSFPDCHLTIEDIVTDGDKAVVRFAFEATHLGAGLGVAPTGRRIRVQGMTMLKARDGKIVEGYNIWDQHGLLQQIGAHSHAAAAPKDRFFGQ